MNECEGAELKESESRENACHIGLKSPSGNGSEGDCMVVRSKLGLG